MSGEHDDLSMLDPEPRALSFIGRTFEVRPLTIGQIPAITRMLRGINLETSFSSVDGALDDIDFMGLIADHGDAIIGAVAIAIGEHSDEVAKGNPDEFIDLVKAIFEVNADFFITRIAPQIFGAIKGAGAVLAKAEEAIKGGAGQTPSRPLSEQDTAAQK